LGTEKWDRRKGVTKDPVVAVRESASGGDVRPIFWFDFSVYTSGRCSSARRSFILSNVRRRLWLIPALLMCAFEGRAQDQGLMLDEGLLNSAEQWARENLDDNALDALKDLDREKVKRFFAEIQAQFHGEYVLDLSALKAPAHNLLPLLESYEETLPYAIWLKSRLDYLDVADEFRLLIPGVPTKPGQPTRLAPNPTPKKEREIWITRTVERRWPEASKPYVSRLKPVFAAQRVPPELVWLAEVESSFDPRARSPAGAAGLFQLMPGTAKRYGLRTFPFDQRLNPDASAQAAAQYLGRLHDRFKDWRLALAAYNSGEQTVQNLLTRRKAKTFDQIAPSLPAETQMYVPRFEAILLRREGLGLDQLRVVAPPAASPAGSG